MIQKLISLLSKFRFYSKPKHNLLPKLVADNELISRLIFSPVDFNKSGELRANAFTSPKEQDEVSVNRFDYCDEDICKSQGLLMQQPENKRKFYGIATLKTAFIRATKAEVVSSPIINHDKFPDNIYHADIKIGFISPKGEPLPSEQKLKIDTLTRMAKLYIDDNTTSSKWQGKKVERE